MMHGKQLCRGRDRAVLHQVNANECDQLIRLTNSEETIEAMMTFFTPKKSKL